MNQNKLRNTALAVQGTLTILSESAETMGSEWKCLRIPVVQMFQGLFTDRIKESIYLKMSNTKWAKNKTVNAA